MKVGGRRYAILPADIASVSPPPHVPHAGVMPSMVQPYSGERCAPRQRLSRVWAKPVLCPCVCLCVRASQVRGGGAVRVQDCGRRDARVLPGGCLHRGQGRALSGTLGRRATSASPACRSYAAHRGGTERQACARGGAEAQDFVSRPFFSFHATRARRAIAHRPARAAPPRRPRPPRPPRTSSARRRAAATGSRSRPGRGPPP